MTENNILKRSFRDLGSSILDQRTIVGVLALVLPLITLIDGLIRPGTWLMPTISEYYYTNLRDALEGVLCVTAFFLLTYKGPYLREFLLTALCGLAGLLVALFPCYTRRAPAPDHIGVFNLPIHVSDLLHMASAGTFFVLLGINSLLFCIDDPAGLRLPDGLHHKESLASRVVYVVCAVLIFASVIALFVLQFVAEPWLWKWIWESVALVAFGVSWLAKGRALVRLFRFGKRLDAKLFGAKAKAS